MPPRATGRVRGSRGRGRGGQGRGASSATSSSGDTPHSAAAAAETSNTSEPAATSVVAEPTSTPDTSVPVAPPESSAPRSSTSQGASSTKPTGSAKFKPKATRRSEAERARIAAEQERLQEQRYAEESKLRVAPRGRGQGRGRGRGGLLRGSGRLTSGGMSFGALSGGGSSSTGGYGQASEYHGGGSGDGDEKVINDGRINADALYGFVPRGNQEEQTSSAFVRGSKKKAMMPMGIRRVEHKEEAITMTTAAEIEAQDRGEEQGGGDSESEMFVDNGGTPKVEPVPEGAADNSVWEHAIPKSRNQVRIKEEPADGDVMDIDLPEGTSKTPDSPELTKKALVGLDEKKKKKPVVKDPEEDLATKKLERMLDLFTLREGGGHANELEGHMFLFQFPSVLPPLKPIAAEGAAGIVKPDPDDDELFVSDAPPRTTTSIDLTSIPDSKVKKEGDEESEEVESESEDELKEGGFIGNLIVRKSGKVELSWGGQTLIVEPGIHTNFFSQAVLLEEGDVKPGQESEYAGTAFGMGRIQGKFTLAPVWGGEEEWDIPNQELEWGSE